MTSSILAVIFAFIIILGYGVARYVLAATSKRVEEYAAIIAKAEIEGDRRRADIATRHLEEARGDRKFMEQLSTYFGYASCIAPLAVLLGVAISSLFYTLDESNYTTGTYGTGIAVTQTEPGLYFSGTTTPIFWDKVVYIESIGTVHLSGNEYPSLLTTTVILRHEPNAAVTSAQANLFANQVELESKLLRPIISSAIQYTVARGTETGFLNNTRVVEVRIKENLKERLADWGFKPISVSITKYRKSASYLYSEEGA